MKKRVVIIGSGNVATSIALALKDRCELVQIYSRTIANAQTLAQQVGCEAISDLRNVAPNADVYIISGSTPIDVFREKRTRYGVLYPMQSFSKSHPARMSEVHIFIEGSDSYASKEVKELASLMTKNVHEASSKERERLHIAAVFACNFANHMFTLSSEVLDEAGIPFDAMLPLIKTTIAKLDSMTPQESQTGPAARGDVKIIEKHLKSLHGDKRKIYKLLSQSIMYRKK